MFIIKVFKNSPRNILLSKYEDILRSKYPTDSNIRELLSVLGYGKCGCDLDSNHENCIPPKYSFHNMMKKVGNIPSGKLYQKYQRLDSTPSTEDKFSPELQKKIRSGMIEKYKKKGIPFSEDEINLKMDELYQQNDKRYNERKQEASQIYEKLQKDKVYLYYSKVQELWSNTNCKEMEKEYHDLDKQVGYDRCSRGISFEERSNIVFNIILNIIPKNIKEKYKDYSFVQSAMWICKGKPVGELDLVISGISKETNENCIIALVEMKANFYCLASAWCRQHSTKLDDRENHTILFPDGSSYQLHSLPEFYVATLIPTQNYLIGAEKSILDSLIDTMNSPDILQDKEALQKVLVSLHEENQLTLSPPEVLEQFGENIIVLL